jgi:hypothetical protein
MGSTSSPSEFTPPYSEYIHRIDTAVKALSRAEDASAKRNPGGQLSSVQDRMQRRHGGPR